MARVEELLLLLLLSSSSFAPMSYARIWVCVGGIIAASILMNIQSVRYSLRTVMNGGDVCHCFKMISGVKFVDFGHRFGATNSPVIKRLEI